MTTAPVSITQGYDVCVRYAAYIRWSAKEQAEGYTKDAQLRAIREYIERNNGELIDVYVDEGKTGTRVKGRTAFAKMINDAENRAFDAVVVHKPDRFARKLIDALRYIDLLKTKYRVEVRFVECDIDPANPFASLVLANLFAYAEMFSKNLGEEVKKGQKEMFAAGRHVGGVPFGYILANQRTRSSALIPGPEAPLVSKAFELYASGEYSMMDITVALNNDLQMMEATRDE